MEGEKTQKTVHLVQLFDRHCQVAGLGRVVGVCLLVSLSSLVWSFSNAFVSCQEPTSAACLSLTQSVSLSSFLI